MSGRRVPRYQELKDRILGEIASGALGPGDRVPSENELVDSAGVSRMTANRALRELTDEGVVERVAGSGTFVAELKAASHPLEVRNIAEEVALRGHRWSADILVQESRPADPATASALHIDSGQPVFHASVVHREDGLPIQLEDRYVVVDFAPDFLAQDFTKDTPSAYLSAISPLQDAEHVVRAEIPTDSVRDALQMQAHEPSLVVQRRTWSGGRPVTWGRLHHPGSRFELTGRYTPTGTRHARAGDR